MMRIVTLLLLVGCAGGTAGKGKGTSTGTGPVVTGDEARADVEEVTVSGSSGAWDFAVAIRSDETGCDQYADWWEVVRPDGTLVFRRILNHSHPDEQPFVRPGGPVAIAGDEEVLVRAHLHPNGFTGAMQRGTVDGGFSHADADSSFAPDLATQAPLPEECWF